MSEDNSQNDKKVPESEAKAETPDATKAESAKDWNALDPEIQARIAFGGPSDLNPNWTFLVAGGGKYDG